ncbi:MAG: elongation factor G [Lentisphaerae bacterium]|nr:elongation factor G [Lentisphaerota bacterium]
MGHTSSGKTTLIDALLHKLGANDRMGSVDAGTSTADYTDEEKARKITVSAKPFTADYQAGGKTTRMVMIDTPGYQDFYGQVICAAHATETAVIVVDASSGVQVGTRRAWRCAENRGLARAVVVTGLDKENTDFEKTLEGIQTALGKACLPVGLPLPDGSVADVLGQAAPEAAAGRVEEARSSLVDLAAETDDALIEKFLGGETLSADELAGGLRRAVLHGSLTPVFVCQPLTGAGLEALLEGAARLFPAPGESAIKDADGNTVAAGEADPLCARVWRSVNDPYVGQLSFVRVFGGTLKSDSEVLNAGRGQKERVGGLLRVNGKQQDSVDQAVPGEIVALAKLKATGLGDTLCGVGQSIMLPAMRFPSPVTFQAVTAKTQADEDKIGTALARVCEEDPTLEVERNTETRQMVLKGLGDVHIDVAVSHMKRRSNVDVLLETPKVAYRETVTAQGEGHYKHKKQSGGRGQYGEVYLRVDPKAPEDEDWFVDAVVGGVIPGNFMPAVQKGLVEGMRSGAVAGYPVTNVKITVYDGSYHDVDSSEIAFKIAAARALKEGLSNAKPVLLEPIMTVRVTIPDAHMGDVNGDLNQRRGRIMGMQPEAGMQVITAEVPMAELFRYAAELRSMTGGQGSFEMEPARYEVVPQMVAQKVVAETQREKQED